MQIGLFLQNQHIINSLCQILLAAHIMLLQHHFPLRSKLNVWYVEIQYGLQRSGLGLTS